MIDDSLTDSLVEEIRQHAADDYPNESCGVVINTRDGLKYHRCNNLATNSTEEFKMCPSDYSDAEDQGIITHIVHSHPDATSRLSNYDIAFMERMYSLELEQDSDSKPKGWIVIGYPSCDIRVEYPTGDVKLVGRNFVHGLQDCWQVCADYYKRKYGLIFPNYQRKDLWWEEKDTHSWYETEFESAGFVKVEIEDIKVGDIIIMQIGRTYHPNHAAVYLGNSINLPNEDREWAGQGPFMLHHMYDKKSEVTIYGGKWLQRTSFVLRHRSNF